ncbi:MAG: PAS domain S-box protein [Magnetospirillum sp. WYHS-4]
MLLLVALGLGFLYREDQLDEHLLLTQEENVRLVQTFANTFWPQFLPFVRSVAGLEREALQKRGELKAIDIAVRSLVTGLPVLKVKLYDLSGLTLYSPIRSEVGNRVGDKPIFVDAALGGRAQSEMSFRARFQSFDVEVVDRWVIETYVPVHDTAGKLAGVLEVYSDATGTMDRIISSQITAFFVSIGAFGFVYVLLVLLVRRADAILQRQHQDLERKQLELRESEQRFRAIADYTFDWESWLDVDGKPRWINAAVERLAGYPVAECLAMPDYPLGIIHEADRGLVAGHLKAAHRGDFATDVEFRIVCRNGAIKWANASYQPIFADDEAFMGSRWSIHDISDRKRAEQRLRESEMKFRSVSQSAVDAIVSTNAIGQVVAWNSGAARVFGYEEADILGHNVDILIPERLRSAHREGMSRFAQTGISRILGEPTEFVALRRHGGEFPIELALSCWDMDGKPFFTAIVRDITERKLAEERLRHSEEILRSVIDTSLDCIVTIDHQGRLVEFNPAAESVFGYRRADVIGKDLAELIVPARHRDAHRAGLRRFIATGQGTVLNRRLELSAIGADGGEFPVELAITVVQGQATPLFTGYLRDITARKEAERQLAERSADLERSNSELQQFAYVASHDLQEPLRMITSYLGLLKKRYDTQLGPEASEFIGFAVDGASRMQRLIKDLLDYSRVGTRGKEFLAADLNVALEEALSNLKARIDETGATVDSGPLPTLVVDDSQMVRLFQNLIGNALKYRRPDVAPRVRVWAEKRDDYWVFAVEDNGIGIAKEHFDRIFMVFQRLHGRKEYEGTGIGLAICKKIVERHGGRIWVESVPGAGTTFLFRLPAGSHGELAIVRKSGLTGTAAHG